MKYKMNFDEGMKLLEAFIKNNWRVSGLTLHKEQIEFRVGDKLWNDSKYSYFALSFWEWYYIHSQM